MSYLVLARKYRPQVFEQVIGQEHVTRTLQNAIQRGRIHHAFLFCGGRGTGKTTTARILAKALSCENAPTPTPCNVCPACVEITNGTSVDVQEIDAASQNRVEDIRDLRESIRYAPVRGKKKLYILDEVHMLSTSAFNALLKTLEEPPPHAVFVFATTDPHKLPQTILSRVQRYDFKLVPTPKLVDHLADVLTRESIAFERGALQLIAREGAGSVRDSLSLLDQVLASTEGQLTEAQAAAVLGVADRGLVLGLGRAVVERDAAQALALVDSAYQRGFDLAQLARTLLGHLRDLVVVTLVKEPEALLDATGSELTELRAQAELAAGRAELLFDRMVRVAEDTSRAPLMRYVLEVGLVELCAVAPLQPVGELLDRLEQLEDRLAGRAPARGGRGGAPGGPAGSPAGPGGRAPGAAGPPASGRPSGFAPGEPPPAPSFAPEPAYRPAAEARPAPESRPAPAPAASVAPAPIRSAAPVAAAIAEPRIAPAPAIIEHAAPPVIATRPAPIEADAPVAVPVAPPVPLPDLDRQARPVEAIERPPAAAAPVASEPPRPAPPAPSPPPPAPAVRPAAAASEPPAPRPAVSPPAPAEPASSTERFTRLMKSVLERDPLMAFLGSAHPLAFTDKRLVLGFKGSFFVDQAQDRRPQIKAAIESVLGHPIDVLFELDQRTAAETGDLESLVEAEERSRAARLEKLRREALGHEALKVIKEVFGAAVSFSEPVPVLEEELRHV